MSMTNQLTPEQVAEQDRVLSKGTNWQIFNFAVNTAAANVPALQARMVETNCAPWLACKFVREVNGASGAAFLQTVLTHGDGNDAFFLAYDSGDLDAEAICALQGVVLGPKGKPWDCYRFALHIPHTIPHTVANCDVNVQALFDHAQSQQFLDLHGDQIDRFNLLKNQFVERQTHADQPDSVEEKADQPAG